MNATDTKTSCPECGSGDVHEELRDGPGDRPRAFGHWLVCESCGHEWQPVAVTETERREP
jgi:uncharacterized Zn finger protein